MAIRHWENRFPPQPTWVVVFSLNVIPAIFFAKLMVVTKGGQLGMTGGIAVLWAGGAAAIALRPIFRFALPCGGFIVALLQLAPIVQGIIALVALQIVTEAGMRIRPDALTEAGGFLATLITGGSMMLIAIGIGLLIDAVAFADNADREI